MSVPPLVSVDRVPGSFEFAVVNSVSLVFPWIQYQVPLDTEDEIDPRSKAIRFLSTLQNLARAHGHRDGRATFSMKLQGRQALKADQLRAVLDVLTSHGAARIDGELVFRTTEADKHRFSGKGCQASGRSSRSGNTGVRSSEQSSRLLSELERWPDNVNAKLRRGWRSGRRSEPIWSDCERRSLPTARNCFVWALHLAGVS